MSSKLPVLGHRFSKYKYRTRRAVKGTIEPWHELSISLYGLQLAKATCGHAGQKVTGGVYAQFDLTDTQWYSLLLERRSINLQCFYFSSWMLDFILKNLPLHFASLKSFYGLPENFPEYVAR
jgi:hypothetical protein